MGESSIDGDSICCEFVSLLLVCTIFKWVPDLVELELMVINSVMLKYSVGDNAVEAENDVAEFKLVH